MQEARHFLTYTCVQPCLLVYQVVGRIQITSALALSNEVLKRFFESTASAVTQKMLDVKKRCRLLGIAAWDQPFSRQLLSAARYAGHRLPFDSIHPAIDSIKIPLVMVDAV